MNEEEKCTCLWLTTPKGRWHWYMRDPWCKAGMVHARRTGVFCKRCQKDYGPHDGLCEDCRLDMAKKEAQ